MKYALEIDYVLWVFILIIRLSLKFNESRNNLGYIWDNFK